MDSALADERLAGTHSLETERETAWILASQRGDALAFNRLVLKWEKPIYNLALRMLQDSEEAAESAQEVFLSAYRNIRRFRHDSRFSTWLYRIAVNQCISRLRRRPPGAHYSLDDEGAAQPLANQLRAPESQEQELLQQESRRRVRDALQHLPTDQRAVVELKFFQELTFEEIATILETPLSTVKTRLYGGLEVLKNRLGRSGTAM
jgi:RNA polymerase sigma-70 factor, ECF subfamily